MSDSGNSTVGRPSKSRNSSRGRPRTKGRRDVADDIVRAVKRLIVQNGHFVVTEKEIAALAGTSESMIHYYFKTRDGLLFSVIDGAAREIGTLLQKLQAELEGVEGNPTRFLIERLMSIYSSQPTFSRLVLSEFMRPHSTIKDEFLKHYGTRSAEALRQILDRLVERGLYRADLDTSHAAFDLLCLVNGPVVFATQLSCFNLQDDHRPWIGHVVELLDRQFSGR